jgi:hypothetical protein
MAGDGHHDETASSLGRYWDELVQGRSVSPAELDPALAATVRTLHARDDALKADPRFADRLLEELMHAATEHDALPFPLMPHLASGLSDSRAASQLEHRLSALRPRWALAQMATAALLALTLVASFPVFGPSRPGRQQPTSSVMPAISSEPASTPAAQIAGVRTKPLLDVVIPSIGDDQGFVAIDRYTIPPATTLNANMRGAHILSVFLLTAGTLDTQAVNVPESIRVIRAGGTAPEESIHTGESVRLAAGDGIVIPENGAADFQNMATGPATLLFVLQPSYIVPPDSNAIPHEMLGGSARNLKAPLVVSVQQATIDPGATLPGADDPAIQQFPAPVDPDRIMDARIGSHGALTNAGEEPLEAYVLTVTSGAAP